jgi:hypothetical protein
MTLAPLANLVRSVRAWSPRWVRHPHIIMRLRMRQRLARRGQWEFADA